MGKTHYLRCSKETPSAASSVAKANSSAFGPTLLQDWWQCAPGLSVLGMRLYRWSKLGGNRKIYNLTLSNVPGPQEKCYLMGATVRARYAFGPVFYGAGLNITVMSLNGSLDVGLVSCSDLLPDLWDLPTVCASHSRSCWTRADSSPTRFMP